MIFTTDIKFDNIVANGTFGTAKCVGTWANEENFIDNTPRGIPM